MGLIRAGLRAISGTMRDQWKEFFYCEGLDDDVLVVEEQSRLVACSHQTEDMTTSSQTVQVSLLTKDSA